MCFNETKKVYSFLKQQINKIAPVKLKTNNGTDENKRECSAKGWKMMLGQVNCDRYTQTNKQPKSKPREESISERWHEFL